MMKRTILGLGAIAVSAVAIVAALIAFTGAALAAGTVSLDSPSVGTHGTATVTLTAAAPNGSGIGDWEIDIKYNPGDYIGDPTCSTVNGDCATKPGGLDRTVRFAGFSGSAEGLTGSVEIGTIMFTSKLAPGACSALTTTIIQFQDENGTDFASPSITNGKVCAPVPTPTPIVCNGNWQSVSSVSPGGIDDRLSAVNAPATDDVWAAGSSTIDAQTGYTDTLVEHWDGTKWRVVDSPNSSSVNSLLGLSSSSANDVWAVGSSRPISDANTAVLIEHWNGSAWVTVPAANPPGSASLRAVDAISPGDAWAIGNWTDGTSSHGLIEHWDGMSWTIVPDASSAKSIFLNSVAGVSSNDIWVVGASSPDFPFLPDSPSDTLVEHWDGVSWSLASSPNAAPGSYNGLFGVAAESSSDVWAVGGAVSPVPFGPPQILHRNGSQWSEVTPPQQPSGHVGGLRAVAISSSADVWAAGVDIEHWNGTAWSIAVPSSAFAEYSGAATAPDSAAGEAWVVGDLTQTDGPFRTLIKHFCEPQTNLVHDASAGGTSLDADTTGFAPRDEIVINPGGANEEYSVVNSLGSLHLAAPLQFAHSSGETIVRVATGIAPGDASCDRMINAEDAISVLRRVAGLAPYDHCVAAGNVICTDGFTALDALDILLYVSNSHVSLPEGCPSLGP
jgi:hypothetical protein